MLAAHAAATLAERGYDNVEVREGDGYRGWPEAAPFDAIIVTAAPDHVPQPLIDQLAPGGRLVIPVGDVDQELRVLTKGADGNVASENVLPVRFVPMTGEAGGAVRALHASLGDELRAGRSAQAMPESDAAGARENA